MTIDWDSFTPWHALSGGVLIGLAAVLLLFFLGRIAGISGIIGSLLNPRASGNGWRVAFLLGLIVAPFLYGTFAEIPVSQIDAGFPMLVLAGLLVGFGARYGSGCTSGHGICGISRFSIRSIVATLCFMGTGFATVFVVRHLLG